MSPRKQPSQRSSLFAEGARRPATEEPPKEAPLAARMRPRTLDEFVGQAQLLEPGSVLRTLIEEDKLRSVMLVGPAGTGKTSLAVLIARRTSAEFIQLSAVTAGVADVRRVVEEGRERLEATGRRTVLFIDEVHRFNKAQQDVLLPGVEAGWIVLVGATTESPFFSIIRPLLSRTVLFRLEALTPDDLRTILDRAVADTERGLVGMTADPDALDAIASRSEGDARVALNGLEAAADRARAAGRSIVTIDDADDAMRQRYLRYDRAGDKHYDVISAFIKSMRGSDPDAALAWLARMLQSGEDPRFIARRMIIFASEDIGLADPQALQIAVAAGHAVEMVGMPEAQLNLAQATITLSLAPKSNAVLRAIGAAMHDVEEQGGGEVPENLKNMPTPGRRRGADEKYKYPHDYPGGRVEQPYRPAGLEERTYWKPEPDLEDRKRRGTPQD
ncbi:MAG TPA: replication-associated recombination protein A [Actinomycetota bacterium]|nr:replication-associated recombination protein A [Actinomycetota bacterium]